MPHPFLSDEWVEEARRIRDEYKGRSSAGDGKLPSIRINHLITDVPFGNGAVKAHTDTSSGTVETDIGHLDNADTTVTLPYATAKAVIIDGDFQVAMQDFMSGKIKVDGDLTKLMAFQQVAQTVDPVVGEINARIRSITE
ncbi:MAG: SCP2 sterol-binding domain-containing protein [Acidimicrobiales bacterium]